MKIQHEGELKLNGSDLDKPLFLKLTTGFDDDTVKNATIVKVECDSVGIKKEY
ncbi:MAG: hypothetical protein ACN23H_01825 [Candidatus Phytoplasma vitis]|nr:MAG: hypothetical protein M6G77_01500 [Candidatus Phytoplasma vitis]